MSSPHKSRLTEFLNEGSIGVFCRVKSLTGSPFQCLVNSRVEFLLKKNLRWPTNLLAVDRT